MKNIPERESSPMRSLERALHILTVMEETGSAMGVTDLGRASQLSKGTVTRMLSVLEKYGYAEKRKGRYRIGPAVLSLANAYVVGNDLTRVALPILQELVQTSEETASLFVRFGFKRILVQRVEGIRPLRFILPIGECLPLHVGAGKVLAAAMPETEFLQMLDELGEIRLANGQPITREALLLEMERVRKQGYAVSLGERMFGIVAVAAPVMDADGATIAAVSLAAAKERMTPEKIERFSIAVRDAASAISEGWQKS
ncbi:MAG: IclR family transcriptional regulator [Smithellaceae bacterium]|nr:IclR family transcriptional regulator [Smithellaceae bacterium]